MNNKLKLYGHDAELHKLKAEGLSNPEIARRFNVCTTTLIAYLRKLGYTDFPFTKRKYTLDESYFEKVDSPEKAYVLGLYFADGYITSGKQGLGITLHPQDVDILYKVRDRFKSNAPICSIYNNKTVTTPYQRLTFFSKKLVNDAINAGCVPKKSKILTYPTCLTEDLHMHFIRGYFDGDGSVYNRADNGYVIVNIVGTLDVTTKMQNIFPNLNSKIRECPQSKGTYQLTFNCSYAKEFLNRIYKDADLYLKRKYEKAKPYLETKS